MMRGGGGPPERIAVAFPLVLAGAVLLAGLLSSPQGDQAKNGGAAPLGVFGSNVRVDDTGILLDATAVSPRAFVTANGTIYVVWEDGRAALRSSKQDDLYFAKSLDGGRTYSRNVPVAVTANMTGGSSRIDIADDGTIFVIWGEGVWGTGTGHFFFSRSTDAGGTFSPPLVIDGRPWDEGCICTGLALGRDGNVLLAGWTQLQTDARGPGFFLARSTDRGTTWASPMRIDDAGFDELASPALAADGAGIVYAVWADITKGEARFVTSVDFGLTFGPSRLVSRPGWIVATAAIAARQAGEAVVVWSTIVSATNYSGTLFLTRIADGGATILPPTKVTDVPVNSTHIYGNPSVAVDGRGFVYAAWSDSRTDYWGDVYFARSIDGGQTFGPNERVVDLPLNDGTGQTQPDVATNANGSVVVVWADARRDRNPDWGGDIYSAVPTYLPDLSVAPSDMSSSPPSPTQGVPVVINATIHNVGWNVSAPTRVRFYNGTPPAPRIGADRPLPSLPIGGTANISVPWTAPPPGTYDVCVIVDPDNLIAESNKTNNVACRAITVSPPPLPDLVVTSADIGFAPAPPVANGTAVLVTATVHNAGDAGSVATVVRFFDGTPPAPTIGSDQPLAPLAPGGTAAVSVTWTAAPPGSHDVCVVVDPDNVVPEWNDGNNAACALASVSPPETRPDYVPISPVPAGAVRVGLSTPVALSMEVANLGNATGTATLAFFNRSTPAMPFATFAVPPLGPSQTSGRFTASWTSPAAPGAIQVVADVDYGNATIEWDEANNRYTWTIDVLAGPVTNLVVGAPNVTTGVRYVTSSTPLSFAVFDQSGLGIRNTMYRVDTGPWVNYTATGAFVLAGEGAHRVEWSSEDFAGNVEPVANATLRVDDTPPLTTLAPANGSYRTATTFTLSATDDGSGVSLTEVRLDGGPWTTYAGGFVLSAGDHTVAYRSVDRLGNREPTQTRAIHVEGPPPPAPEANLKPLVAAIFVAILAFVGAVSARRAPWPKGSRRRLQAFLFAVLPFAVAEGTTGVLSLMTGLLAIPPLVGAGTAIDLTILVTGVAVSLFRVRTQKSSGLSSRK